MFIRTNLSLILTSCILILFPNFIFAGNNSSKLNILASGGQTVTFYDTGTINNSLTFATTRDNSEEYNRNSFVEYKITNGKTKKYNDKTYKGSQYKVITKILLPVNDSNQTISLVNALFARFPMGFYGKTQFPSSTYTNLGWLEYSSFYIDIKFKIGNDEVLGTTSALFHARGQGAFRSQEGRAAILINNNPYSDYFMTKYDCYKLIAYDNAYLLDLVSKEECWDKSNYHKYHFENYADFKNRTDWID